MCHAWGGRAAGASWRHRVGVARAAAAGAGAARPGALVPAIISVIGGCAMVALGAQVRIPVPGTPVPMTLQTLAVVLVGFWVPPRRALAAMLVYLGLGALGCPVFAGSGGLASPAAGFLAGFAPGAWFVSRMRGGRAASIGRLVVAGGSGLAVSFAFGVAWLAWLAGGDVVMALAWGLWPFVVGDVLKLGVAVSLVVAVRGTRGWRCRRGPG